MLFTTKTVHMKATKQLILWATCICLGYITQAQMNPKQQGQKSYVKVNLLGLPIRNIGMQYEKTLSKRVSFALGYRFMPKGPIPFKATLIEMSDKSADAQTAFNSIKFSNYAITPEIRIYAGKKGYGRGFYVAPFMRYGVFNASGVEVDYSAGTITGKILMDGNIKATTAGIMIGAQWALGKRICLDWFILGPHYGSAKGVLSGTSTIPLPTEAQQELSNSLGSIDIPFVEESFSVNANGAKLRLKGPWAGVRGGLSLGIKL